MRVPTHFLNTRTGVRFDANPELIKYASEESYFKPIYSDVDEPSAPEVYTLEILKSMNMKELQGITDDLEIACDRRKKDDMIDAILKSRG
jgi:hypothetical protein